MKGLSAAPLSCGELKAPVPSLLPVLGFPFSFLGVCSLWAPLVSAVTPEQPGMKGLMPFQERTHSFLPRCLPRGWAVWWPCRDSDESGAVWLARITCPQVHLKQAGASLSASCACNAHPQLHPHSGESGSVVPRCGGLRPTLVPAGVGWCFLPWGVPCTVIGAKGASVSPVKHTHSKHTHSGSRILPLKFPWHVGVIPLGMPSMLPGTCLLFGHEG